MIARPLAAFVLALAALGLHRGGAAGPAAVCTAVQVHESEHFLIDGDVADEKARQLIQRLEAVYRANLRLVHELHTGGREGLSGRLAVVYYTQYVDFQAAREAAGVDDGSLGYFEAAHNRCVFFDFETHPEVVRLRQELEGLHQDDWGKRKRLSTQIAASLAGMNERIVQHEAAHMIQANIGLIPPDGGAPTWLIEALAQLFELPFVERGASIALSVNGYRLREFQRLHCAEDHLTELRRLVADDAWRGGPDYSLAWALANYLYVRQRERFAAYVRDVTRPAGAAISDSGNGQTAAPSSRLSQFEQVFGPLDCEFVGRFDSYVKGLIARNLPAPAAFENAPR